MTPDPNLAKLTAWICVLGILSGVYLFFNTIILITLLIGGVCR